MELGVYSFGDVQKNATTGERGSTAEAQRNLLEAIRLSDEVGLDFFGIGEHHTRDMPASAAAVVLGAAAAVTKNIKLGSAVTVISTDDPVRVYQQFATVDALSNGRAEIVAGRGSSTESFPLFGYSLMNYDELYAEKLDLLLQLNASDRITWQGKFRPALEDAVIVPRPDAGKLPIWLATGGNPQSSMRAAYLGLPISYAIIGGEAARFAPLADLYRRAAETVNLPDADVRVSVASLGFFGEDGPAAREFWFHHWQQAMAEIGKIRGFQAPSRYDFDMQSVGKGALFVGAPEEIAERIVTFHREMGHMRQFFQMDLGHLPQKDLLHSIELLGTRIKPLVDAELGTTTAVKEKADA